MERRTLKSVLRRQDLPRARAPEWARLLLLGALVVIAASTVVVGGIGLVKVARMLGVWR